MNELVQRLSVSRFRPDRVWVVLISMTALLWLFDPVRWPDVMMIAVTAFSGTLLYVAFAVLLIGYISASGADGLISAAFRGRELKMIWAAALIGGLAPFCSCEVIPFIAGLLRMGVPLSGVMAFWLSSPLIDPPTLLITAAALGWPFAVAKAVVAVALGLAGGYVMYFLSGRVSFFANPLKVGAGGGCQSCGGKHGHEKPLWMFWHNPERQRKFGVAVKENTLFLIKWLALAYFLEGLMITYVPASMIKGFVGGDGVMPVVLSALIGAPAYLNSYIAPPLVAGLMTQGMTAGAGMAFMVAGAVSSIPAMTAVYSLVRPPVFVAYLLLGMTGAIIAGLVYGEIALVL